MLVNTSMQVFAEGGTQSRLVWIDTLPDELTGSLTTAMDQFVPAVQEALRSRGVIRSRVDW